MICEKVKSELDYVKKEKERVQALIEKAPPGKGSFRGEAVTGGMERKGNEYAPAFTFPSASADSP